MIKDIVKDFIGQQSSKFSYPILINSYGRSGSTVLMKSIINSAIKLENKNIRDIAFRSMSQEAWDLERSILKDGIVYKTHDYPPEKKLNSNTRMLYTFADPVDVVLSLIRLYDERGESWMKKHYQHLQVPYSNFDRIVDEDQLCLEKHLESWLKEKRFPVAFVKYELLWDHQEELSDFLGFPVVLPPFRTRKTKKQIDIDLISKLHKTYGSLRKKVNGLDTFFINE